jgi:hypothetical protein
MAGILYLAAVLELIGGVLVFATAESIMQEILGELAVGFSVLTFGMAALVSTAQQIRRKLDYYVDRISLDDRSLGGPVSESNQLPRQNWRWPWKSRPKKRRRTIVRVEPR